MIDATASHAHSRPQLIRPSDLQVPAETANGVPRSGNRLGGLPILYKVLIANAAIVALGASYGGGLGLSVALAFGLSPLLGVLTLVAAYRLPRDPARTTRL